MVLAEKAPAIPRLQLLDRKQLRPPYDAELTAIAGYADGIGPSYSDVDAELVAAAHRHGLKIHVYTVNDPGEMNNLATTNQYKNVLFKHQEYLQNWIIGSADRDAESFAVNR